MGLWSRLFKAVRSTPTVMNHPNLGWITRDTRDTWLLEKVEPLGCRGTPDLSLAGDQAGPRAECLQTYERLRNDWDSIKSLVEPEIFQLNQNYFSDDPARALASPAEVWATMELLGIGVWNEGQFELTYRFDWQDPADGHEVTVYFGGWKPQGHSVDG